VEPQHLEKELEELRASFPRTTLMYVGDKTFGQSQDAVENLQHALSRYSNWELIVQTHVTQVRPWLVEKMVQMNVRVVEIGFETASSEVLSELKKSGRSDMFPRALELLEKAGILPVLNVLGGLPYETSQTWKETLQFLDQTRESVWLYNLYNFVPYPKTPLFPALRPRIVDWCFDNWREDAILVYTPYHISREESWQNFLGTVQFATELLDHSAAVPGAHHGFKQSTLTG
jgi:uncharacterized radical SAM superfamily protein